MAAATFFAQNLSRHKTSQIPPQSPNNKEKEKPANQDKTNAIALTTLSNQTPINPAAPKPTSAPAPDSPSSSSSGSSSASSSSSSSSSASSTSISPSSESSPSLSTPVISKSMKKPETPAPDKSAEKPKPPEAPATQTTQKQEPTDAEIAEGQKMLHKSVAEHRYFGTPTGCCAKICHIFKVIMFFLFGRFGFCLGKAQDKNISIGTENSHIAAYEKALDEVVASLPREQEALDSTKLDPKLESLYRTYKDRQKELAALDMLQPQVRVALHRSVLADLKAKIEKHNQKNPTKKIDAEHLKHIQNKFARHEVSWFAQFITPECIVKDGLNPIASFAVHYHRWFGDANMPEKIKGVEGAALLLRAEIAANEKLRNAFCEAMVAASKKPETKKFILLLDYFSGNFPKEDVQAEFLTAVFAPKTPKTVK